MGTNAPRKVDQNLSSSLSDMVETLLSGGLEHGDTSWSQRPGRRQAELVPGCTGRPERW